jgi:beta-lactamase superfamily II metal-dependent hydrolase
LSAASEPSGSLKIYFIDVMGGAATLIVTPEKETILIDTGWPGEDDRDPKRIVHVLKDLEACNHLDHLIITHWHMDHFGGVAGLSRRLRIEHFWDRGLPEDGNKDLDFPDGPRANDPLGVAYRKAAEGKRAALRAGDTLKLRSRTLAARVLASSGKVISEPADSRPNAACEDSLPDHPVDPSDNARSLALKFQFGRFDFLDCGDLTWNVEKALVCPVDRVGPIDLYQVTHHGLDISNHPTLLRTIQPTVTIMNNGPRKGGTPATVKRLRTIPSIQAAYQLHRNAKSADDENTDPALIANDKAEGGRFIRVTVSPDGSHFSVQLGTDGPAREFDAR